MRSILKSQVKNDYIARFGDENNLDISIRLEKALIGMSELY